MRRLRHGILHSISTLEILLGGFGLLAALVVALLLASVLDNLPGLAGDVAPVGVAILLAPIGIGVALSRRDEVERALDSLRGRTPRRARPRSDSPPPPPPARHCSTPARSSTGGSPMWSRAAFCSPTS